VQVVGGSNPLAPTNRIKELGQLLSWPFSFLACHVHEPSDALNANRVAIPCVVEAHRARNARVFGSVLHGEDVDGSDLDILVDPTPETT
jgi:hypothetical protein